MASVLPELVAAGQPAVHASMCLSGSSSDASCVTTTETKSEQTTPRSGAEPAVAFGICKAAAGEVVLPEGFDDSSADEKLSSDEEWADVLECPGEDILKFSYDDIAGPINEMSLPEPSMIEPSFPDEPVPETESSFGEVLDWECLMLPDIYDFCPAPAYLAAPRQRPRPGLKRKGMEYELSVEEEVFVPSAFPMKSRSKRARGKGQNWTPDVVADLMKPVKRVPKAPKQRIHPSILGGLALPVPTDDVIASLVPALSGGSDGSSNELMLGQVESMLPASWEGDAAPGGKRGNPFTESGSLRRCSHCATTKTPQWRAGPNGPKTLCNACGVRFKSGRLCNEYRPASSPEYEAAKHSNSHRKIVEMRKLKEQGAWQEGTPLAGTSLLSRPPTGTKRLKKSSPAAAPPQAKKAAPKPRPPQVQRPVLTQSSAGAKVLPEEQASFLLPESLDHVSANALSVSAPTLIDLGLHILSDSQLVDAIGELPKSESGSSTSSSPLGEEQQQQQQLSGLAKSLPQPSVGMELPKQETKSEPVQLAPPAAAASTPLTVPRTPPAQQEQDQRLAPALPPQVQRAGGLPLQQLLRKQDTRPGAAKAGVLSSPRRPPLAQHTMAPCTPDALLSQKVSPLPAQAGSPAAAAAKPASPVPGVSTLIISKISGTGVGTPLTQRSMSAGTTTLVMVPGVSVGRSMEQQQGSALASAYGSSGTPQQQKGGMGGEQERLREQLRRRQEIGQSIRRQQDVPSPGSAGKGGVDGEQAEAAESPAELLPISVAFSHTPPRCALKPVGPNLPAGSGTPTAVKKLGPHMFRRPSAMDQVAMPAVERAPEPKLDSRCEHPSSDRMFGPGSVGVEA